MRLVFASDSFKGSLSSREVARILSEEAVRTFPGAECVSLPMADGGEGTLEAVVAATGAERRTCLVHGPLGDARRASWALLPNGAALVEMAEASGLTLVAPGRRDPLRASTYGTGQLVEAALDAGAHDVTLAIGGSATNDGGMGMLRALGARFLDASGVELEGTGADLAQVSSIDLTGLDPRARQASFHVMCDVDNPLLGPRGATRVFGPQKGAGEEALEELEAGMGNFARVTARTLGQDLSGLPGAGAAGGLGFALAAFLGARLEPGVQRVLDLVGFNEAVQGASLCVTGEGHLDAQTAGGKVVRGVAERCASAGVPCVALVGGADVDVADGAGLGLAAVVPLPTAPMDLDEALDGADQLCHLAAERLFSLVAVGRGL